jgi:hypothetical protein
MWVELQCLISEIFGEKKFRRFPGLFLCLWAFFEGVLENADGKRGVFCGEVVVKCVANVVVKPRFPGDRKIGQDLNIF